MKLIKYGLIICSILLFGMAKVQDHIITFEKVIGATITPMEDSSSPVQDGGNYAFKVTLDPAYNKSTIVVKVNGDDLLPEDGVYNIRNITEDKNVTLEDVVMNTYTVTLETITGATITPTEDSNSTVQYGGDYKFKVTLDLAYNKSTIVVKVNGDDLLPEEDGVYNIRNITEDKNVTLDGVQINTYKITFVAQEDTVNPASIEVIFGEEVGTLPQPERTGYIFVGWFTKEDGEGTQYTEITPYEIADDITLFANWKCELANTVIVRKGTSNILICKDVTNGNYNWGYFNSSIKIGEKKDKDLTYLSDDNYAVGYSYYEFKTITNSLIYFVDIHIKENGTETFAGRAYYTAVEQESAKSNNLNTYPNPTKEYLSVALGTDVAGKIVVTLQNLSGQTFLSKQIVDYQNSEVLQFDLNCPAGIYLLVVQTSVGVLTSKIVIE